jgi:hypothetical protein
MQGDSRELKFLTQWSVATLPLDIPWENFMACEYYPSLVTISNATAQPPRISKGERL